MRTKKASVVFLMHWFIKVTKWCIPFIYVHSFGYGKHGNRFISEQIHRFNFVHRFEFISSFQLYSQNHFKIQTNWFFRRHSNRVKRLKNYTYLQEPFWRFEILTEKRFKHISKCPLEMFNKFQSKIFINILGLEIQIQYRIIL